jgi:hypothetical protein
MQNAFVESSEGRLRDERPNVSLFSSPHEARRSTETWPQRLQHHRTTHEPHGFTTTEFAARSDRQNRAGPFEPGYCEKQIMPVNDR